MITIKDIAKIANVSTTTVSRIINGKGEASKETIEKVLKIAKELNYSPNRLARSLSTKSSNLIAILVPNLNNPFFAELVTKVEKNAEKKGFRVLLCNTNDEREKVEYFLNMIRENYVFGAIICTLQVKENDLIKLEENGIHTVTIDRAILNHKFSSVNVNQYFGTYIAIEHLIKEGAKKIIFISGPKENPLSSEREKAYLECLIKHNITKNNILYGDFTLESGYYLIKELLDKNIDFDGIFAANDLMAIGAMKMCSDFGLKIPEDIKVVGNDNLEIVNFLSPALTSLSQESDQVSYMIIEELLALKEQKITPRSQIINPKLIIRETSIRKK